MHIDILFTNMAAFNNEFGDPSQDVEIFCDVSLGPIDIGKF